MLIKDCKTSGIGFAYKIFNLIKVKRLIPILVTD